MERIHHKRLSTLGEAPVSKLTVHTAMVEKDNGQWLEY